jgi:hypothetical protein
MMTAAISTSWTNALSDEDLSSRFSHLVTAECVSPFHLVKKSVLGP